MGRAVAGKVVEGRELRGREVRSARLRKGWLRLWREILFALSSGCRGARGRREGEEDVRS